MNHATRTSDPKHMRTGTPVDVTSDAIHQPPHPLNETTSLPADRENTASPAQSHFASALPDLTSLPTKTASLLQSGAKERLASKSPRHPRTSALPTMAADAAGAPPHPSSSRPVPVADEATSPQRASVSSGRPRPTQPVTPSTAPPCKGIQPPVTRTATRGASSTRARLRRRPGRDDTATPGLERRAGGEGKPRHTQAGERPPSPIGGG